MASTKKVDSTGRSIQPEVAGLGVRDAFKHGLFTIDKTDVRFSDIAIDQAHDESSAMVEAAL